MDQIVTLETARLAEEVGFNGKVYIQETYVDSILIKRDTIITYKK